MNFQQTIATRTALDFSQTDDISLFVEQRWGAMLTVDVVGSTHLMSIDEAGTYSLYKSLRRDLIDPKITEHHARFVKSTGDGILAEFRSALDAVRCAVHIQQNMVLRSKAEPNNGIVFRIGLSCGRIIADHEDIYGYEVNMAARLQALAPPGGIAMSSRVAELIHRRLSLQLDDLGVQTLRNMGRAVHVFQCRSAGLAQTEC